MSASLERRARVNITRFDLVGTAACFPILGNLTNAFLRLIDRKVGQLALHCLHPSSLARDSRLLLQTGFGAVSGAGAKKRPGRRASQERALIPCAT